MTEPTPADGKTASNGEPTVNITDVKAGQQQQVGEPLADAKAKDTTPDAPVMPEGGHEKYWNAEKGEYNWEAHARELAWQGAQKQQVEKAAEEGESTKELDSTAQQAADKAGVNIDELSSYYSEHGELSEEHLKRFEEVGIPPEIVKEYFALKTAQNEAHYDTVVNFIGGEQGLAALNSYMQKTYTKAEIMAFNEKLADPTTWRATATILLGEAGLARGGMGLHKGPNEQGGGSVQGPKFATESEFNAAMRDPRYKSDPTFRQGVMEKLRNSPHLTGR